MKDGKNPWQSVTLWAGGLFTLLTYAESQGVVPQGGSQAAVDLMQALTGFATVFGLRRAIPGLG